MNFNPYQNNSAGIAALGPVQAMSDRNEAQTYMANGGQMFASGGIARLAEGGALPKYKYDPVTQRYTLQDDDKAKTAMEEELLRQQRAAQAAGGGGSTAAPSAWDQMSNAEKAAYYAANPTMAAITQMGQKAFGLTGLGALQNALVPDFVRDQGLIARGIDPAVARADRIGNLTSGYETVGGPGTYGTRGGTPGIGVGSREGINAMDAMSDSYSGGYDHGGPGPAGSGSTGGGLGGVGGEGTPGSNGPGDGTAADYARGGLMALAGGGITGSGNLDLHIPLDLGGGGGGGGYTAAGAGGQYGFNGQNNAGGGGFGAAIDPQGIMSDTFKGTNAFSGNPTESINNLFNVLGGKAMAQGGMARSGMSHLGDYSDGGRLLRGPGDGVSDSIPATIGDKRPARLADGEFVVPARIVSELGNGSTEAGARKLYAMMDRIQKARGKTVGKDRVAVNSRADKNLPA